MHKKNLFSNANMLAQTVRDYYVGASLFDHFVFHFIMEEEDDSSHEKKNSYSIFAFAIDKTGEPMNDLKRNLVVPGSTSEDLGKKVQIGNIRLTRKGLEILYPDKSKIKDLTITPEISTKFPGFVRLRCQTNQNLILEGFCNPSPPGRSEDEFEQP